MWRGGGLIKFTVRGNIASSNRVLFFFLNMSTPEEQDPRQEPNLVKALQKVIGAKSAGNLLQAYGKIQALQFGIDSKYLSEVIEINDFLESAIDDIQSQQLMHDLFIKGEDLLAQLHALSKKLE